MIFRIGSVVLALAAQATASWLPGIPFSGPYGATAGAGSTVAWERSDLGGNPAALSPGEFGVALSGYSPFGLDGIGVWEAGIHVDGKRWGSSLSCRGVSIRDGGSAWVGRVQQALRLGRGITAGAALAVENENSWGAQAPPGMQSSLGLLWSRFSFFSAGAMLQAPLSGPLDFDAGFGADLGAALAPGMAWRLCAEIFRGPYGFRNRYGARLRLHEALSAYAGFAPEAQTFGLGVRFGLGAWEGFHALRRHAALGTTSLQGVGWRRRKT